MPNFKPSSRYLAIIFALGVGAGLFLGGLLIFQANRTPLYAAPVAPEVFGALSGRLTSTAGEPLAGIVVELYRRFDNYATADYVTTTDSDGHYQLQLIATGIYVLRFQDPTGHFATQYYPAAVTREAATALSVNGNEQTGLDDILEIGGQITGLVTTTANLELGPVIVKLLRLPLATNAPLYADLLTLMPGEQHFQFRGLSAGSYAVCASGATAEPTAYTFAECYDDDLSDPADPLTFHATPLTISVGAVISNVDFVFGDYTNLDAVNGAVVATGGTPLAGMQVSLWQWRVDTWQVVRETQSDEAGAFHFAYVGPGRYAVGIADPTQTYVFERPNPGLQLQHVITLNLPVAGESTMITATLVPSAQITGVVTLPGAVLPSNAAVLLLYERHGADLTQVAYTSPDPLTGRYRIKGLRAGTYQLYATDDRGYARFSGYYGPNPTAPADVILHSSEVKRNLNFTLVNEYDPYQGLITGTVMANQQPLAGMKVQLFHQPTDSLTPVAFAFTDIRGRYQLGGLPDGDYFLGFSDPNEQYATIYYPQQPVVPDGDSFQIRGMTVYTNINAALTIGGAIEGHLYLSTGQPFVQAQVISYWQANGRWRSGSETYTDAAGYYRLPALLPGTYRLGFYGWIGHPTQEYYDNAGSVDTATDIVVRAGITAQADAVMGPRQATYLPLLQR